MKKIKQRNWLLIITGLLLFSATVVLFFRTRSELGLGVCYYLEQEYYAGQSIPNYQGRDDCHCTLSGDIQCEGDDVYMEYDSFGSEGLLFSHAFRNYVEKDAPDLTKIVLSDVSYRGASIVIVLEREVRCGDLQDSPPQVALYERKQGSLVLTNITNRDQELYNRPCIISNSFTFSNLSLQDEDSFSLMYQNESGQLFDLGACFENGILYSQGDVFKDMKNNSICTCVGPEVECEDL